MYTSTVTWLAAYEYIKLVSPDLAGKGFTGAYKRSSLYYYTMMGWSDMYTSTVTWLAAYDKYMDENNALENEAVATEAIQYADQVVRRSQGSGTRLDVSRMQAHNEGVKLLTMFISYFNSQLNEIISLRREVRARRVSVWQMAAMLMWTMVLASMFEEALLGHGEEDEEWEDFAWRVAKSPIGFPFALFPLVRDIHGALKGFSAQGTPATALWTDVGESASKLWEMASDEDVDAEWGRTLRKNLVNSAGLGFGWPAAQTNRIMDALTLVLEEDAGGWTAARVIWKGPTKEERKTLGEN